MAKLNMLQCDRCGKNFEDHSEEDKAAMTMEIIRDLLPLSTFTIVKEIRHHFGRGGLETRKQDLCRDCQVSFDDWWEFPNLTK